MGSLAVYGREALLKTPVEQAGLKRVGSNEMRPKLGSFLCLP